MTPLGLHGGWGGEEGEAFYVVLSPDGIAGQDRKLEGHRLELTLCD